MRIRAGAFPRGAAECYWHLQAAADSARLVGLLNGLRDTALRWRAELGERWHESEPLALYPAFSA